MQLNRRFRELEIGGVRTLALAPKSGPAGSSRILYIHGGAYVFDLSDAQWGVVADLVDRTESEVVVPLYRLAPEGDAEAGLEAVHAVYRQLCEAVGARNICVIGDSAGGGLALALAQHLRRTEQPCPASLVLYFPWLDASLSGLDQPALEPHDPVLDIGGLRECGEMWSGRRDPQDPLVSPLFGDQGGLPPTLILSGTRDILISDTRRYARVRPDVTVSEYAEMFHGFVAAPIPEARRALDETETFIKRHQPAPR